jgi:hypothetical protein
MSGGRSTSRARLFRYFAEQPSPRIMLAALFTFGGVHLYLGEWSAWDAFVAGAVVFLWPLNEWVLHVYVLHARPIRLFGRTFEMKLLTGHGAHHLDPLAWKQSFIDPRALLVYIAMNAAFLLLVLPSFALALTGLCTAAVLGLVYEWTHFLIHTDDRPRTRAFKRLWVSHRLHHFKSEKYWFGVTMLSGDRLLGTQPDPSEVETSPTCRTLGRDAELVS